MIKKDINYRQGRTKKQVEENEKLTFFSLILFLITFSALLGAKVATFILQ